MRTNTFKPSILAMLIISSAYPHLTLAANQKASGKSKVNPGIEEVPVTLVIGDPSRQARIGGAATVVTADSIDNSRAFNINEVLRKVPGVFPREEEGFGLRPNIGLRGLNPTRSTKVLLLEDGLPIAYSPYGDNASYFHPTMERFSSLEVLKGSAQIAFGPHTVGGVINYLTPNPPEDFGGKLRLAGGNQDYGQVYGELGNTFGEEGSKTGVLVEFVNKQADGTRRNMDFDIQDYNLKVVQQMGNSHALTFKASRYEEDSNLTYTGLTKAEYEADPRQNPFKNDEFATWREAQSLVHQWDISGNIELSTAIYRSEFHRDWWRQSSNSGQRPNDSSDPACGGMVNLNSSCGNEGRLRDYELAGIEPRLTLEHSLGTLKLGIRYQEEEQERLQVNSDTPRGRIPGTSVNGGIKEQNTRNTEATAWFIENSFEVGNWTLTPGARHEQIDYERYNHLKSVGGSTSISETFLGLGAAYKVNGDLVIFAGAHEGFSPPRVEDIINNDTGGSIELGPETSVNTEFGLRYQPAEQWQIETALFQMDFDNQIVPASVAGGSGATLTSAGETLHRGLEALVNYEMDSDFSDANVSPFFSIAWTWVKDASFEGTRTSSVTPGVSVSGNRLPYAPEHTVSTSIGLAFSNGVRAQLESVYVDSMFTDDLNTRAVTANGQRGLIPSYIVHNLSLNYALSDSGITLFTAVKNITNELYVVDMSRGIVPGMERLVQGGVEFRF